MCNNFEINLYSLIVFFLILFFYVGNVYKCNFWFHSLKKPNRKSLGRSRFYITEYKIWIRAPYTILLKFHRIDFSPKCMHSSRRKLASVLCKIYPSNDAWKSSKVSRRIENQAKKIICLSEALTEEIGNIFKESEHFLKSLQPPLLDLRILTVYERFNLERQREFSQRMSMSAAVILDVLSLVNCVFWLYLSSQVVYDNFASQSIDNFSLVVSVWCLLNKKTNSIWNYIVYCSCSYS